MKRNVRIAPICRASILKILSLVLVALISGCGGGGSSDDDGFRIIQVQPDEGSSTATIDSDIIVSFNKPVNETLANKNTFYLTDEHTHKKVDAEIKFSDDKQSIILSPKALLFERHYSMMVNHTITDTAGQHIVTGTKEWKFFTQERPAVREFSPKPGATDINTRAKIRVRFESPVDATSINTSTVQLLDSLGQAISTIVEAQNEYVTITPTQDLALNTTFTVTLNNGISDSTGAPVSGFPFSWSFTTRSFFSSSQHIGTQKNDAAHVLAIDQQGNIYIAGETEGQLNGNVNQGEYDAFLTRYDTFGNQNLTVQFGSNFLDSVTGLVIAPGGDLFLSSNSDNRAFFDPQSDQSDVVLFKVPANGGPAETYSSNSTDKHDISQTLVTDGAGNLFIVGSTMGGMLGQLNQGEHDIFISAHNTSGANLWTQQYGTTNNERALDALFANNLIYVLTDVVETTTRNGEPIPPPNPGIGPAPAPMPPPFFFGPNKYKLFAFDASGNFQWEKTITEEPIFEMSNLAFDASTASLFVASFGPNLSLTNPSSLESATIRKLDLSGNEVAKFPVTTEEHLDIQSIEVDSTGNIYMAGITMGQLNFPPPGTGMGGPSIIEDPESFLKIFKLDGNGTQIWKATVNAASHARITDMALNSNGEILVTGFTHGGVDGNTMIGTQDAFLFKVDSFGNLK